MLSRIPWLLISLLALATLVAACGSSDEPIQTGSATEDTRPTATETVIPVEPDGGIGDTPLGDVPFFGGNDTLCPSTTLRNELDDQERMAEGVDCLMAAIEAGTPIVWDLIQPTVEGDPIYHRFAYDGATVTIVVDNRLDAFGSAGVMAQRCAGVTRTTGAPVGVDCTSFDQPGFPEAD